MAKMSYSEYLNTQHESYFDCENNADNEVIFEKGDFEILTFKWMSQIFCPMSGEFDVDHRLSFENDEIFAVREDGEDDVTIYTDCSLRDLLEELDLLTYDVVFDDDTDTNGKGFAESFDYCKHWIESEMRSIRPDDYFRSYKGGSVSIWCNELEMYVYSIDIN